jgi:hypothetical protein
VGDGINWSDRPNWDINNVPTGVDIAHVFLDSPVVDGAFGVFSLENTVTINVVVSLTVAATANNEGTILVSNGASAGSPSFAVASGTLGGTGEVLLVDSDFAISSVATLFGASPNAPPTIHAAGHTVRGEGSIEGKWLNESLIRAEETSGDMSAALQFAGTMINSGVIRSSPTAVIVANGLNYTETITGQFIADTQDVLIIDATFNAGTLSAINGATYELFDVGNTPQVMLNGATLGAPLNFPASGSGSLFSNSGFINNSTITVDNHGGTSLAQINFMDTGTIGGTGEIILNRESNNTRITGATITNGASHTIRGVGAINTIIINDGAIIAEPKNGTALIINSSLTNNNLLQVNAGATLRLPNNEEVTQDDANGRIRAENGGVVDLRQTNIVGGRLQTAGTGVIQTSTGAGAVTDVTNEGTLNVLSGDTLSVIGTLTNSGVITVNSNNLSVHTAIEFDGDVTMAGTGTIVLNRPGGFGGALQTDPVSAVVTQSAGHTIRGNGQINAIVVNHGRMEGNSAAAPLEINGAVGGDGVLKDVRIDGVLVAGGVGTSAIVPLEGSYLQSNAAQLWIDLGGTTPGSGYDQLNSTGSITLNPASQLVVSMTEGFVPAAGNQFTIATTTGSRSGTFGTVWLPTNIPNYELTWKPVAYTPISIMLEVLSVTSLLGDYNANGIVDAGDYIVWRKTFGQTGNGLAADGDGSGTIDPGDLNVWRSHFGQSGAGAGVSSGAAVPEANTITLMIAMVFGSRVPVTRRVRK